MSDKIGWDADFYNSLTNDVLNVSLTQREIYVLGNMLPMVSWSSRWSGNITGMDLDAIRGELEFTLLDEIEVGEMSCLDVADCIETDETVKQAIVDNVLNQNGYTPNPETNISTDEPLPTLTPAESAQELLPDGLASDCTGQPQLAMGLARAIVKELHESAEDLLETLEYATNTLEAWENIAGSLPSNMTSVINIALGWVDWLIETFQELYQAAYTQDVEDELSCAIFCYIMDNCSLSLDALQGIYQSEATIGTPPDGMIETLEFIYTTAVAADKIAVAAFHYQILRLLAWGKVTFVTAPYIKSLLASIQNSDYSYQDLCEDCPQDETPDTYWRLAFDFRISAQGWVPVTGSGFYGATYNQGWETPIPTLVTGQTGVDIAYNDLGDS